MKSKINSKNFSWILLGILIIFGMCLFAMFQINDRNKLQNALNETISFTKLRIKRYDTYRNNDQVKSLVRLLDKTEGLSKDIDEFGTISQSKLDEYADIQRLTGIMIFDENLNLVMKSSKDVDSEKLWDELIHSSYVSDIIKYSQKTYSTRMNIDGNIYDFTAVSRKDAAGMVATYVKKDEFNEVNGDLIFDTLFADFPFEMNGVVVVCDDENVVSSNNANLMHKSISECRELFEGEFKSDSSGIVRLRADNGTWYGRKDAVENYTIYMFFPASQIFMNRNIVCSIYILVAALIYLLHILGKSRAERERDIERDKELRSALASAEHANKAKTAFLNNMSHDIRTPMNAIIGFTALAVTHIDNKEHVLDYLKKISTSSKHLLSLINDVLDMSRIENGSVRIEEAEAHLPDILHDLRSIIQGNIGSKQQDLYIDTQDVLHEDIIIDKLRLNQILINIISNAVKFTPVGGMINVRITEKPCSKSGYATYEFSVKDNGIGIDKEFQEHIFDSFSREQSVTESGIQGTGLGLAIVKNIVDMMGGTIKLNSEKGKGSEFIVILDCKISEKVVKYEPIKELSGARALVVDDDIDTCMSVSKMLRQIDIQADWTTSGKEAVMRAKEAFDDKRAFAVYIIDWMMPDMNGIETVRRIRRVIGDDASIIILTAYDWTDIEEEAKAAGVTAFVAKPIFMSELRNILTKPVEYKEVSIKEKKISRYAGKKILLVEDNELNREIAIEILQKSGFVVDAVEDGTDAVERMVSATEDQYDLILMDIQMPKMDGYTATREIRTLGNNKKANIPIIAMTANAFEEDRKKAFEAGMNAHISKPVSVQVVLETLEQVLG